MVGTDPGGSEKYKYDFQNLEDRTFQHTELRFAIRSRLHGHRDHFLKIGGRTWPRFLPEINRNQPQNDLKRPRKGPKPSQNHPKRSVWVHNTPYGCAMHRMGAQCSGGVRKVENRIFTARPPSLPA